MSNSGYHRCRNILRDLCCDRRVQVVVVILAASIITLVCILCFAVIPRVKANVEDARLDTFQFTTRQVCGSFFSYNISVALAVRNPNKAMSIRCTEPLVATFIMHDRRLSNVTVIEKGHGYKWGETKLHVFNTTGEVPSFLLGAAAAEDFKEHNATGLFEVEVRLSGEITYKEIIALKVKRSLSMSCLLRLQLAPPGPEVVVFQQVTCKPVQPEIFFYF